MSRFTTRAIVIGAVVGLLGVASYAVADGGGKGHLKAGTLTGYEENPDISTAATGTFEARIIGEKKIAYKLTLFGPGGHRPAGAHPLREGRGQRRRLGVPVQQPPEPAARHARVPRVRQRDG